MEHNKELKVVIALLKYKELHVRRLARITNEPQANISRLMKRLLEKNVVEFVIEGKNKLFFPTFISFWSFKKYYFEYF